MPPRCQRSLALPRRAVHGLSFGPADRRRGLRAVTLRSTPSETASHVFADDRILDAASAHFRQAGFPYRRVPIHVAMQALNKLATTAQSALLSSRVGYDVVDSYHPHRFRARGVGHLSPVDAFGRDALAPQQAKSSFTVLFGVDIGSGGRVDLRRF